jgi:hypothetical protein
MTESVAIISSLSANLSDGDADQLPKIVPCRTILATHQAWVDDIKVGNSAT